MARKESITRAMLLDAACALLKEEGEENLTVRKVAARANCSTQPIFRIFKGMEELTAEVFRLLAGQFGEAAGKEQTSSKLPFVGLAMSYIHCAKNSPHVFRFLFLPGGTPTIGMYDILNGAEGRVATQLKAARAMGVADPGGLFSRLWIFVHGAACMSTTGDFDLNDKETIAMLEGAFQAFSGSKA